MGVALNATTIDVEFVENLTRTTTVVVPAISDKERIRMEFYQTYDVMTGIRIAATLGGFFTMMVMLVLYKSKCKSKADESLEAAITAAVAEEEEMEAALNQSKYNYSVPGHRQSLGTMSAPTYTRFSSLGGYGGLMNPPKRYERGSRGRISLPASDISFRYFKSAPTSVCSQEHRPPFWKSYNEEEENDLEEVEENEDINEIKYLPTPDQRRSVDLDDGCHSLHTSERRLWSGGSDRHWKSNSTSLNNQPNIQVIQATPQISPSESSSGLLDEHGRPPEPPQAHVEHKLAPLASIGSCSAISLMESDRSMGSDSVFINSDTIEEDDTDKDQDELSSPKSDQDCTHKKYRLVETAGSSGDCAHGRRYSDSSMQSCAGVDKGVVSLFPIVTNLANEAGNQTTTSLYNKAGPSYSSSSSTSLSSSFSFSNSAASDKRQKGVFSTIAIIDVTTSPIKGDGMAKKKQLSLSKSEPKTINAFCDHSIKDLRTLSLSNLINIGVWNKETLF